MSVQVFKYNFVPQMNFSSCSEKFCTQKINIDSLESSCGAGFMYTSPAIMVLAEPSLLKQRVMGDCPLMDVLLDLSLWPYPRIDAHCRGGKGSCVWVLPMFQVDYLKAPYVLIVLSVRWVVVPISSHCGVFIFGMFEVESFSFCFAHLMFSFLFFTKATFKLPSC